MKNAIVTGANGFIGSAVVADLLKQGMSVTAIVRNGHNNRLCVHPSLRVIDCDMEDIGELPKLIPGSADVFYHFAWEGTSGTRRDNLDTQLQNVRLSTEALKVAATMDCPRFVGAGSLMEYEAIYDIYTQRKVPKNPLVYLGAKVASRIACSSMAEHLGIDVYWGTITNAYGVGEVSERFIVSTIKKILKNQPLKFTSAVQNYDFVYITDVAHAFFLIGEYGLLERNYVIGSGNARPLKELIFELRNALVPERELEFGAAPYNGTNLPPEYFDIALLQEDTGYKPEVPFIDGVIRTAAWLKTRTDGV